MQYDLHEGNAMKSSGLRGLIVLLFAGAGFTGFFVFLTPNNLLLSIVAGLAGLFLGAGITGRLRAKPPVTYIADGLNKLDFDTAIKQARDKQRLISNEAFKITNMAVRQKVDKVADVIGRVIDQVKADPTDYRAARQFFDYYIEATLKIVRHYVDLYGKSGNDPEIAVSMQRVEETLETMRVAYEKQLTLLLENDKLSLDTELTVLRRTIEMEGLGNVLDLPSTDAKGSDHV
jgi:5-bromo-4-chloroindolyl phosphate hydrolysis protein